MNGDIKLLLKCPILGKTVNEISHVTSCSRINTVIFLEQKKGVISFRLFEKSE